MARDLPDVPQSTDPTVRRFLVRMREAVQQLMGVRGDGMDAAITLRDAMSRGIVDSTGRGLVGDVTIINNGGGGGSGGGYTPDLTPPPTVTGLSATAGLANIIIEWDAALYTVGNGHKQTNIYAVKKAASDATLPTFGDAALVFSATGALTIATLPSDLSVRWHLWAKYETNDDVESVAPAGGVNGVVAQTGKIGNTDLGPLIVEAQNMTDGSVIQRTIAAKAVNYTELADGAVRVQHLLVAPKSLITDSSFAQGGVGWNNFVARYARSDPAVPAACPAEYAAVFNGRDCTAKVTLSVTAGEQYLASVLINRNPALATVGIVAIAYKADGTHAGTWVGESAASGWVRVALEFTIPTDGAVLFVGPWNAQAHGGTVQTWFADMTLEKKADASLIVNGGILAQHLAAGSIAVGTAAIANGAILNAMIADATIDSAKIANLSVSKLLAGALAVGQHIISTNYVAGVSGWYVGAHGFAEFSNVVIRGATYTGTIYAGAGTIGGITITAADIRSTDYVPGGAGFRLTSGGYLEASNVWLRGQITGGAITGYAWPAAGSGGGFYLGPSGLLLGSAADGKYFQVTAAGDVYSPQFSIVNGNATLSGNLNGAGGTFSGVLTSAAVNAINSINLAGDAVTVPMVAQGSGNLSLPLVVPSGRSYKALMIGFQSVVQTTGTGGSNVTLSVPGASATQIAVAVPDGGETGGNLYFAGSFAVAGVQVYGGGTHTLTLSGNTGAFKTFVVLVVKS